MGQRGKSNIVTQTFNVNLNSLSSKKIRRADLKERMFHIFFQADGDGLPVFTRGKSKLCIVLNGSCVEKMLGCTSGYVSAQLLLVSTVTHK